MSLIKSLPALTVISCLTLAACGTPVKVDPRSGQYWQRSSVSDAAYQQGPKAQQMLNRDIATCVTELKELERLGEIREAIPANAHTGQVHSQEELDLMREDSPTREKALFAEHGNYHDFEGCMLYKGWERVLNVPYEVATQARETYLQSHIDYKYQSRYGNSKPVTYSEEQTMDASLND